MGNTTSCALTQLQRECTVYIAEYTEALMRHYNTHSVLYYCYRLTTKGKTSLDLNEARDDGVLGSSGISRTICKQFAPRSRQITTPTTHHSIFHKPDALPDI